MKMVSCIIRPEKLDTVTTALNKQHVVGMTVTEVRGFGRQKGHVEHYRGGELVIRFVSKVKMDVVVQDEDVEKVMNVIEAAARTGKVGDGKVFVTDVSAALRIRTGETGTSAL
jgi:nitrogen regulatory protein P-II 2